MPTAWSAGTRCRDQPCVEHSRALRAAPICLDMALVSSPDDSPPYAGRTVAYPYGIVLFLLHGLGAFKQSGISSRGGGNPSLFVDWLSNDLVNTERGLGRCRHMGNREGAYPS